MKSKLFYNIARYLLAALFIFSGFSKAVNPFGLSIQFDEYFAALSLDALTPLSALCAIALPTVEMVLGFMLLFGLYTTFTRWAVGVVMAFFTGLTLWIAIANPVSDCGCFGDLIKISNWATFYKNLFFDLLVVVLLLHKYRPKVRNGQLTLLALIAVACAVLPIYCYMKLPLIETTPYAVGKNIGQQMVGSKVEQNHTILIYKDKQSGQVQQFEMSDTTWQNDARWEYVDSKTTTTSSGEAPAIESLVMTHPERGDITQEIINHPGTTYAVVVPDPNQLSKADRAQIETLSQKAAQEKSNIVILYAVESDFAVDGAMSLTVDRSTLNTMIQNRIGGVILIKEGNIIDKWAL